jgi:hypothetical protein
LSSYLTAPNPLPYAEFIRALRGAAGVRFGLPAPRPLLEAGFEFADPEWPEAAPELVSRYPIA